MKRFWKDVVATPGDGAWRIELDGRPVRTPARAMLVLPTKALADAVASEWRAVGERLDPRAMPLTGLANAAIDRVEPDPAQFALGLAKYAEADLTCYRAQGPQPLVQRQSAAWDELLGWARRRFDIDFCITDGIVHVPQPPSTVERLTSAVRALDSNRLAGLAPLVTIGGSLVAGLAVLERAVEPETAWAAVTIDDRWQSEKWGVDSEAEAALEGRRRDFLAGARFLELLDAA